MYDYPFPRGELGIEDEEEEKEGITKLFETDDPRIRGTMAHLAHAYDCARLEGNKKLMAQIEREARERKASLNKST